ncbi:2-C-methyl-D-erythritol 4-phosphate cytidylyltransferase [Vitreoscilla massiliensis]|uniref:2-C-methyl-D-erythritol 4-phosphate cytidylyltransferase n=1 Tax=Vitreoscilla massiliensis TaxID=1689272 RepID=A0ABY4DYN8_9NEIS|nr:2-C-methyl-D-erythritol 4-phosphate cytidylyltransferase [Vitreoscilla massiliensis]UOO88250.1 2-C-methyl-D-erythritol 4-phosphate cytidylyltransferase [Vitreoscilla massiliensis]
MSARFFALVPAAGVGSRFGAQIPKQYTEIAGQSVLMHTLQRLLACEALVGVAVVLSPDDGYFGALTLPEWAQSERLQVLYCGGDSRAESVRNGIAALTAGQMLQDQDWLLVHDAARCCLPTMALERLLAAADADCVGAILALPVADTLKKQTHTGRIDHTVDRSGLWQAQTPQMFRAAALQAALNQVDLQHITDEASAMEAQGVFAQLVQGDVRNLKLTLAQDATLVELLLNSGDL